MTELNPISRVAISIGVVLAVGVLGVQYQRWQDARPAGPGAPETYMPPPGAPPLMAVSAQGTPSSPAEGSSELGVRTLPPEAMGGLDRATLFRVARQHAGDLRACYQMVHDPKLKATVTMKYVIAANGVVAHAVAFRSSVSNEDLKRCMITHVRSWVFPRPAGGGVVVVNQPFVFEPAAADYSRRGPQ